eukprot:m.674567 g.674567  ORF g.674567 m.674567 type:complete len:71 (+) comp58551_c0_seq32:1043-1255(+)
MGLANLAVVFAPTLFYIKGHKGEKMLQEVEIQVSTATTLQIMIDFHEIFAKILPSHWLWSRLSCFSSARG